uniref:Uncharacterized protein n=1 Tax=Brassica oleracea TaxID=3712 RepID=A0A3P6EDZ5_BRAOL|nr:unnamed protein product [Brassica oleracea]
MTACFSLFMFIFLFLLGYMRKATKLDPHLKPCRHFVGLGELLISSDIGAALDGFKMEILISSARTLMKMGGQEVPIEFVNDIVALHFRKEEFDVNSFLHFSLRSTILRRLWLMEYGLPFSMKTKN